MPYMVPCIYILPQDPSTGFSTLNFNIEVFTVLLLLSRVNQACFQHSFSRKKKTKTQNKTQEFTFLNWNRCDLESIERRQVKMQMFFIILILFLYIYMQLLRWIQLKMCLPFIGLLDTHDRYVWVLLILPALPWHTPCLSSTADQSFGMWPKIEHSLKKASPKAHSRMYKEDTFFFHYIKAWIVHLQTNNHSFPWQNK